MLKHLFLIVKLLIVITEISAENVSLSQVIPTTTKLRKEKKQQGGTEAKSDLRQTQINVKNILVYVSTEKPLATGERKKPPPNIPVYILDGFCLTDIF